VFYIWIGLATLSIIPGLLVKEDLRRLNMKNVDKSNYFEDIDLMKMTRERRNAQFAKYKIIADKEVYDKLDVSDLYRIDVFNDKSSF